MELVTKGMNSAEQMYRHQILKEDATKTPICIMICERNEDVDMYDWTGACHYFDFSTRVNKDEVEKLVSNSTSGFLSSLDESSIRYRLREDCSIPTQTMSSALENAVIFCLQRNPWDRHHVLFDDVHQLLLSHMDLVNELNDYYLALSPSNSSIILQKADHLRVVPDSNFKRLSSVISEDSCGSSSIEWDSDEDKLANDLHGQAILRADEITIMRTFMLFASVAFETMIHTLPDRKSHNLKSTVITCAKNWRDYTKFYI